jgi:hypothetical protein
MSLGLVADDSRPKPNKNTQIIKFKTNMDKHKTIPPLSQTTVSVSAFLTGKAKQDFEVFQIHRSLAITNADRLENYKLDFKDLEPYKNHIWRMDKLYLNALLIEWFDSLQYNGERFFSYVFEKYNKQKISNQSHFNICEQAIATANEIYNMNVLEAEH